MIKKLEKVVNHMSLLYVDDNRDLCENNIEFFKEMFKDVDFALNGGDALDMYKKKSYDLVITDINMPKLNGLSLIREIYKIDDTQPVIVVSAYSEIQYLSQIYNVKVDYFLVKPVETKKMIDMIYAVLTNVKEVQD